MALNQGWSRTEPRRLASHLSMLVSMIMTEPYILSSVDSSPMPQQQSTAQAQTILTAGGTGWQVAAGRAGLGWAGLGRAELPHACPVGQLEMSASLCNQLLSCSPH